MDACVPVSLSREIGWVGGVFRSESVRTLTSLTLGADTSSGPLNGGPCPIYLYTSDIQSELRILDLKTIYLNWGSANKIKMAISLENMEGTGKKPESDVPVCQV